jgi:hypothetical protein
MVRFSHPSAVIAFRLQLCNMALLNFVLHIIFKSWLLSTSLFALLFLAYQAVQTFRTWFRLSHIKGPLSASLSKWWMIRAVSGGRMHLDFWEVCQKYGMPDIRNLRSDWEQLLMVIVRSHIKNRSKPTSLQRCRSLEENPSRQITVSTFRLVYRDAVRPKP